MSNNDEYISSNTKIIAVLSTSNAFIQRLG